MSLTRWFNGDIFVSSVSDGCRVLGRTLVSEDRPSCSLAGKTGSCVCDCVKPWGVFQPGTRTQSWGAGGGALYLVWAAMKTSVNEQLGPRRPEQVRDWQCVEQHTSGQGDEEGDGSPAGSEQEQFGLGGTKMALPRRNAEGETAGSPQRAFLVSLLRVCPVFREP